MNDKQAIIYISDNCSSCTTLLDKMDEWGIPYLTKNVTRRNDIKKELQNLGIYGTPATFVDGRTEPILGLQLNKLKQVFNVVE